MLGIKASVYESFLRPLLFRLPPEVAQKAADLALRQRRAWSAAARLLEFRDGRLFVNLCGITLENPVGLAAGYDKNCELLPSLVALGFGYLTGGTVTEFPRAGNPKPRLLRLTEDHSLINALGFPNKGLEHAARQLEQAQPHLGGTLVAVSVSGSTIDEFVRCHRRLEPLVDAIELNISSPNTESLRAFHEAPTLAELIGHINERRTKPLMVKLPSYPSNTTAEHEQEEARERLLTLVKACLAGGVDAVTVANSRPTVDERLAPGIGGLSGRAIFSQVLRMVVDVRAEAGDGLTINACGGIFSGQDAWEAFQAGATTVQLYTGLVYHGPAIVKAINRELLAIMEREGTTSLSPKPQRADG